MQRSICSDTNAFFALSAAGGSGGEKRRYQRRTVWQRFSYVGPAVIKTFFPFNLWCEAKKSAKVSKIFSGSSIRPLPIR